MTGSNLEKNFKNRNDPSPVSPNGPAPSGSWRLQGSAEVVHPALSDAPTPMQKFPPRLP